MELPFDLAQMDAQALRDLAASLIQKVTQQSQELQFKQLKIDQLTHEIRALHRIAARRSARCCCDEPHPICKAQWP